MYLGLLIYKEARRIFRDTMHRRFKKTEKDKVDRLSILHKCEKKTLSCVMKKERFYRKNDKRSSGLRENSIYI